MRHHKLLGRRGTTGVRQAKPDRQLFHRCFAVERLEDRWLLSGSLTHVHKETSDEQNLLMDRSEPTTIRVGPSGAVSTVAFNTYVQDVLPNEWPAVWDWPSEAYRAGAIAAKMYGWWRLQNPRDSSFDVSSDITDQVYVAGSGQSVAAQRNTTPAVAAVRNVGMERQDGQLFKPLYWSGACLVNGGGANLRPSWGTNNTPIMLLNGGTQVYAIDNGEHYADGHYWLQVAVGNISSTAQIGYVASDYLTGVSIGGNTVAGMAGRLSQYGTAYWANSGLGYQAILSRFYSVSSTTAYQPVGFFSVSLSTVTTPSVATQQATLIGPTSAILNATVGSDGGGTVIERRFSWGLTPECSAGWTSSVVVNGSSFSYSLNGLVPGQSYHFQAWAKNSTGWGMGEPLWFTTPSQDTVAPTLSAFSANRTTIAVGQSVTLSYTVSDAGGSGLKQTELWRTNNYGNWPATFIDAYSLGGNGPSSASFTSTPPLVGDWWYGLHVVDGAGNVTTEQNAGGLLPES